MARSPGRRRTSKAGAPSALEVDMGTFPHVYLLHLEARKGRQVPVGKAPSVTVQQGSHDRLVVPSGFICASLPEV
jgi:hypothetical protein